MDFARLQPGCVLRYFNSTIAVREHLPMPSPNQARVDKLLSQFIDNNEEVPAEIQAICDNLLLTRFPEPANRLPRFVLVHGDLSESDWELTPALACDRGFVLVSGTLLPEITPAEAADALAASIAGYGRAGENAPKRRTEESVPA